MSKSWKHGKKQHVLMPMEVTEDIGLFDKFAGSAASTASRAPFFAGCVLLILVWAPTILFLQFDTWQLLINTATTIVTFLMVALLQNSQARNDQATQHKLNALVLGLAHFMQHASDVDFGEDVEELLKAVGLELIESTN